MENPKEEPKHPKVLSENGNELFFDEQGNLIKEEPKQETLEEAKKKFAYTHKKEGDTAYEFGRDMYSFDKGAKWQAEQDKKMYSEEEVYTIQEISDLFIPIGKGGYIDNYLDYRLFSKDQPKLNFKEWFEKLKKQ